MDLKVFSQWLFQTLGWVPTGTKGYCTLTTVYELIDFSNVNTYTSVYATKRDRKKKISFGILVMWEEPI